MPRCSVDDCGRKYYAKGWCEMHYQRVGKYGDPDGGNTHAPPETRFWRRVSKKGEAECWDWKGSKTINGYGRFQLGGKGSKHVGAHRYAHQLATGETPQVVMHICDRPCCVNPAHLRSGTYKENTADMMLKNRHRASKLTPDQVKEIRAKAEKRCALLAEEYKVSESAVWAILRGETWKHIE